MREMQRMAVQRSPQALAPRRHADAVRARPAEQTTVLATPAVLRTSFSVLQPKLMVGAANDPFEREADRTADAVMTSPERPAPSLSSGSIAASLMRVVQRALGKGEAATKKDDDEKKKLVQKAPAALGASQDVVPAGIEAGITRMSAGGEPLSPSLRGFFEPRFGWDFSPVRT